MGFARAIRGSFVALVVLALAPAVCEAQCPSAREFGGQGTGGATHRIKIDTTTTPFPNDGNEFGTLWRLGDPATNGGGAHFPGAVCQQPVCCPVDTWYVTGGMFLGTDSGIQGFIASPGCAMTACPAGTGGNTLVTVVEDTSADGTSAGFVMYVVDETPAQVRWFDHGRTGDGGAPIGAFTTHPFVEFPRVDVKASAGPPPHTVISANYADVAVSFHGVLGSANTPLSASTGIAAYDVLRFHGPADPGRLRSAGWSIEKSIPYSDAAIIFDDIAVPCSDTIDDNYVAIGLEYADGVKSVLVGAATIIECDPNIAEPADVELQRHRARPHRTPMEPAGRR